MAKYKVPSIEELLDVGAHFGHQSRRWHPKMEPYIFAERMGIHVIDLEQTESLLKNACDVLYKIASEGGRIIFVGTKRQSAMIIESEAKRSGSFFVNERWLGGTITNFGVISKNIKHLVTLKSRRESGDLEKYTKKERLLIDREIEKLDKFLGGLVGLTGTPQALFVVDAKREKTAIREANAYKVPVVALIDTNTNPEGVQYVIPGNDDAIRSIALFVKTIGSAIEAGYKEFAEKSKNKEVTNSPAVQSKVEVSADEKPLVVSTADSSRASKVAGKKMVAEIGVANVSDVIASPIKGTSESKADTAKKIADKKKGAK